MVFDIKSPLLEESMAISGHWIGQLDMKGRMCLFGTRIGDPMLW